MRLTGGKDKGHPLASPHGPGIRPTSDRVREALFNILGPLDGEVVLDLFSGAGTLGLEALSRGVAEVCFVDGNLRALRALEESLSRLKYDSRARVLCRELPSAVTTLVRMQRSFDLVFMDPPYGSPALSPTLVALAASGLILAEGRVVVEHDREDTIAASYGGLEQVDQRRYGRTLLSFFQA